MPIFDSGGYAGNLPQLAALGELQNLDCISSKAGFDHLQVPIFSSAANGSDLPASGVIEVGNRRQRRQGPSSWDIMNGDSPRLAHTGGRGMTGNMHTGRRQRRQGPRIWDVLDSVHALGLPNHHQGAGGTMPKDAAANSGHQVPSHVKGGPLGPNLTL